MILASAAGAVVGGAAIYMIMGRRMAAQAEIRVQLHDAPTRLAVSPLCSEGRNRSVDPRWTTSPCRRPIPAGGSCP